MSLLDQLTRAAMFAPTAPPPDLPVLRAAVIRRLRTHGWAPGTTLKGHRPSSSSSDEALLQSFVEGDAAALDLLCNRLLGKLVAYAQRYVPAADADDIVQDAFLVLLDKAALVLTPTRNADAAPTVAGFLFGTVRTLVRKKLSRHYKVLATPTHDDAPLQPTSTEESALDKLLREEEQTRLVEALERACNPLEQDVVLLVLEGLDGPEIATRLELQGGHVRKLKHDALAKLRKVLGAGKEGA